MEENADLPRWAESLQERTADWTADEAASALRAIADTIGRVIEPHRGVDPATEIGVDEPPEIGSQFDVVHDGETVVHYDELPKPGRIREAANELLEIVHWTIVGVEANPVEIRKHSTSLASGVNHLDLATERLAGAILTNLKGNLASVAKSIIDRIKNAVQQAVGKLWQHLKGMSSIDSWQVSGSLGTSMPGFSGTVSLGLTFK